MTPTLENFFRQPLGLIVLSRDIQEESYRREVVLTLGCEMRPILYGAIRILLGRLPEKAREGVLEERFPLGHILQTEAIPHLSWPQAFFRAEPDTHMTAMLQLQHVGDLYGRRNVLVDGSRRLLAEVIEVLAPVGKSGEGPPTNVQDSKP
jgi:chorismate-pyruvate lyase